MFGIHGVFAHEIALPWRRWVYDDPGIRRVLKRQQTSKRTIAKNEALSMHCGEKYAVTGCCIVPRWNNRGLLD